MKNSLLLLALMSILSPFQALADGSACSLTIQMLAQKRPLPTHEIYTPKKVILPPRAVRDNQKFNTLEDYRAQLGYMNIDSEIAELYSGDGIADFSGGNLAAIYQVLGAKKSKISAFALTFSRDFTPSLDERLKVLNRPFEYLRPGEIPEYNLALDIHGAFSTTTHLDYYMKLVINRLRVGGKLFIAADFDKISISYNNKSTAIKYGNSIVHRFEEWMKSNRGISYAFSPDHKYLVITRTSSAPFIVSTMDLIEYSNDGRRHFREVR